MADFRFFINRQGPQGPKGEKGDQGEKGNSIIISDGTVTPTVYTLIFDRGDGNTFETQNIRAPLVDNGGTYVRFDRDNGTQYLGNPNYANLSGGYGEVKLATTTSVAQETVSDTDAVSYELFRQSGGGGGGTSFVPGTALELTNQNVLNVKIDGTTITTNGQGQLVASGGGGGTSYTAADPIYIDNNVIKLYYDSSKGLALNNQSLAVRVDDSTIGFDSSGQLTLKATIPAAQIQSDWNQADSTKADYIKNKPTIGAGVITFTQGATVLGTIDVNQTTATTINIPSSGGGGGGGSYAAGNGIEISDADVISTKVDNSTIGFTASGELELKVTIPTDTSDLTNGAGYITSSALSGYATETWVGGQGYLTSISSGDVTTALGYTPYSASNPDGYTSNVGTVTSVNNTNPDSDGNVTLSIPDTTYMVTTNTTQSISGTKTFSNETHFTGNITFDSALGTPIIRGMSGASYRNMITRSNTYSTFTAGNTSDNLILKGALTRPKYSHDSSDGGYLALYSDIPGDMTGASAGAAGTHGLVPAPAAGDNEKFLRGDGTWQTVSSGGSTYTAGQGINANQLAYDVIEVVTDGYTLAFNSSDQLVVNTSNLGIPTYTSELYNDSGYISETSLETVHCVIDTYQNGDSWYRLYDDGWVEQGGNNSVANTVISFLVTMADTSYCASTTGVTYKTTSGFTMTTTGDWEIKGYAAI